MVSLDLQDAYLQVPIHHDSLRGRRKDVPVQGPLLRSHNRAPSLHEDYGSHFRLPPQVWTIDSSWPIQNSSLVYLGMEIRSFPFMARPPPVRVSNLLRLLEEFRYIAVLGFVLYLIYTRGVSVNPICEGVSFSLPVSDVSFLSDASDVGCGPS